MPDLAPADYDKAAVLLGCDAATIRALVAVEAKGCGFGPDGRPTILFEPHVFFRETREPARGRAAAAGLAYPRWGTRPYPPGQSARWAQFEAAAALDRVAAIRSTSFGLGQIMGFNARRCGYGDEEAFYRGMLRSEGEQLLALVELVRNFGLASELREHRWALFAQHWNGAGWRQNRYDERLAAAFDAARRRQAREDRGLQNPPAQTAAGSVTFGLKPSR